MSVLKSGVRWPELFPVLTALLVLAICVQGARLFWTIATPVKPLGNWQRTQTAIMPPAMRAALFAGFDPYFRTATADTDSQSVTSLALTLFGIRTNEASGGGSAILAGADGVQQNYIIGNEIMPGVTLTVVAFDHVVLSNNGALETLYLDQSVPAETVGGASPSFVTKAAGPDVRLNPENMVKSIGLAPRNQDGRVTGLVVTAKDDGTMMRAAGLRAGDIVVSVNGSPVTSPADLATQLRPGARLSIEVERGAQKVPLAIILE